MMMVLVLTDVKYLFRTEFPENTTEYLFTIRILVAGPLLPSHPIQVKREDGNISTTMSMMMDKQVEFISDQMNVGPFLKTRQLNRKTTMLLLIIYLRLMVMSYLPA